MRYGIVIVLIFLSVNAFGHKMLSVNNLRCESMSNSLSITTEMPRFSWQIKALLRDTKQSSYHILVADTPDQLKSDIGNCWDTEVVSGHSIQIAYAGRKLESGKKYFWKVKIRDQAGNESSWSETSWFQMGLLTDGDWGSARWIGFEDLPDSMKIVPGIHGSGDKLGSKGVSRSVVPLFRKELIVDKKIANATLSVCGLGQYEVFINGERIGQSFLSPGWTDYDKTCLYNSFDVRNQLQQGKNAVGVIVGNGFYNINRERYRKLVIAYGYPKMICKLRIEYSDKTATELVSGTDWKTAPSPIEFSSIYGGEDYNAQLEQPGWARKNFDDSGWKPALQVKGPSGKLTAESDHPVTVNRIIQVRSIENVAPGKYLYDFGQNASGILELKVRGQRGSVIKLTPGELITPGKEINQKASGSPFYYTYTLKGDGVEVWRPKFSYYGFRYIMVEGAVPEKRDSKRDLPVIVQLDMLHTCNSSPRNGEFSCSNQLFNQIYSLIDWAIRSNMQSVVTDCPHREKLGWLEQTYLMGASVHYNYELYNLYRKTIRDMMDAQTAEGLVPDIAPEYTHFVGGFRDSPEWGSAAVILPSMMWKWYGDSSIVREAIPMMQKYVDYLGSRATNGILAHGLGDWFDYGPKSPGEAQLTPKAMTATAIYYYDIQLLAEMMKICDQDDESKRMESLAKTVRKSFNDRFFNERTSIYATGSQTAMAISLCVGLVEEKNRAAVLSNLISTIGQSNNALTAGDIGFHFLVKALEEGGASQLLFNMNFRNDLPGYGFQLKKGATALTESWPALEEVSNNHLMLGHLMEWFYTGLAGIKQGEGSIAFKDIVIRPEIVGDITWVKAGYISPYGKIGSSWEKIGNNLEMRVDIPANTHATIIFPLLIDNKVTENGKDIVLSKSDNERYFCEVGSGSYLFKMKLP
jgi:hypothetical protein